MSFRSSAGRRSALAALAIVFAALLFSQNALAQKEYPISAIQGPGDRSPHESEAVTVTGVVTAKVRTGFFLQTPDDKADADPMTSEGIFVFTKSVPPASFTVGDLITVGGTVVEYRARNETGPFSLTELSHRVDQDSLKVVAKGNPLPKPAQLSALDFKANVLGELEKYEGMRVFLASMTVVAPTNGRVDSKTGNSVSDGVFYVVIKGTPRPFREPGLDIRDANGETAKLTKDFPKLKFFDANPELIRVDTDEQKAIVTVDLSDAVGQKGVAGSAAFSVPSINVPARTELANLTGVLHFASGRHSIFADYDKKLSAASSIKAKPLTAPNDRQFSVAGMNLENFFDDADDPGIKEDIVTPEAFERRLKKISLAIRDYMQAPDVIGAIEVENLAALKKLAARINADAVAAGKPNPKYEAFLIDGNDPRGIDNGFLIKTSRVKIAEMRQFGKDEKYKNPDRGGDNFLNDRPPLLLRASIDDPKTGKAFEFTVIVNHLKSLLGYNDPKQQDNVRTKKRLQAEFLARFVQERQKQNPDERMVLLGDFNAFQFDDGVLDVIGTIKGTPAGKDEVMNASNDLVDPDLINLVDVINAGERYSFNYDGSAQVLDHMLINEAFKRHVHGFGYARVNADFPEIFRNDANRVERYSDHDPAIAYFTFDDVTAAKK